MTRGARLRPRLTPDWLLGCSSPGCSGSAAYYVRVVLNDPERASLRCATCTYQQADWLLKHWPVAHLEVKPLS